MTAQRAVFRLEDLEVDTSFWPHFRCPSCLRDVFPPRGDVPKAPKCELCDRFTAPMNGCKCRRCVRFRGES